MRLSDIKIDTKVVEMEFPGIPEFKVKIGYVSRETSRRLRKDSTITKLDSKLKMAVTELDADTFTTKFVGEAIKGWTGLKLKYLPKLLLVDISNEDEESELEYNLDNAIELIKESEVFDKWINEVIFDLERFRN